MFRSLETRLTPSKIIAACAAVGLHVAVLAAVLVPQAEVVSLGTPESEDVMFVEFGASAEQASMPAIVPPEPLPLPPTPHEPAPESEPVETPAPVEPVENEAVESPESLPRAVSLPPKPERKLVPVPVPEPEPEPRPEPKPQVKPRLRPAPPPRPKAQPPLNQAQTAPQPRPIEAAPHSSDSRVAAAASAPQGRPVAVDPDRPRTIGRVDYLGGHPRPVYPRASQRRGERGRVVLRVLISPEGRVADVSVRQSSGHRRLDDAALDAVRTARFKPYTENGIAYKALVDIPFDFVL
jgi:protein TonB